MAFSAFIPNSSIHENVMRAFINELKANVTFNEKGEFDVLASHANFISLVKKRLTIRETENEDSKKDIAFDNALIRVRENLVEVYVGVEGMNAGKAT